MNKTNRTRRAWGICGAGLLACAGLTGCQVSVGGQTLPSPYFIYDDVQYFPQGHEFILQNEADFLNAANAPPPPPGAEVGRKLSPPPALK